MKNYKSLVTGSLIAAMVIMTPIATFAEGNNKNEKNNVKAEQNSNKNHDKFSKENLFFNKIANMFDKKENFDKKANVENNVNTNLKPSISGMTAPTVLKAGEIGTWVIKATDPKNGSLSYSVDWGDKNIVSRSFAMLAQPVFVQTGTFTHTYANKGEYKITFIVKNDAGLQTTSKVTVHITSTVNVIAPVISNILITSVKSNKATINWNTDTKSNTMVWFSKTSPVDISVKPNNSRKALVLNHKIEMKKLEANTKYYVIVGSTNDIGTTKSVETSFTTPAIVNNSNVPVITSLTGPTTVKVGDTETVTVNAYSHSNETLSYSANWGDTNLISNNMLAVTTQPVFVQTATFNHVYSTVGTYTAIFTAENSKGEKATSSMTIRVTPTIVDGTAPVISGITTNVNGVNATISWITNELSTSNVFYSTTTPIDVNAAGVLKVTDSSMVTNHSINIPNLTSSTLYHFIVKSLDSSNNAVFSSEATFVTN